MGLPEIMCGTILVLMWFSGPYTPGKPVACNLGCFQAIMGYVGVWSPLILGCLAVEVVVMR